MRTRVRSRSFHRVAVTIARAKTISERLTRHRPSQRMAREVTSWLVGPEVGAVARELFARLAYVLGATEASRCRRWRHITPRLYHGRHHCGHRAGRSWLDVPLAKPEPTKDWSEREDLNLRPPVPQTDGHTPPMY